MSELPPQGPQFCDTEQDGDTETGAGEAPEESVEDDGGQEMET